MGSNDMRKNLRNEIHALIYDQDLPQLFITINPAVIHNPLVLMYGGEKFNLDDVLPEDIPNSYMRTKLVAKNPKAAAQYFRKAVDAFLHILLGANRGVHPKQGCFTKEGGILGHINAYYSTVEAQGRGSLHLHLLVWLTGAPSLNEITDRMNDPTFKQDFINYLETIICEDCTQLKEELGLEERDWGDALKPVDSDDSGYYQVPMCEDEAQKHNDYQPPSKRRRVSRQAGQPVTEEKPHPCSLRPPEQQTNEQDDEFRNRLLQRAIDIARKTQLHYHNEGCYKYRKTGEPYVCRFGFCRELCAMSHVDEESKSIHLRRQNSITNSFNLHTLVALGCNNDVKFISANKDAKALVYYITDYVTKSSLSTYNYFTILKGAVEELEVGKTYSSDKYKNLDDILERSKLLITRCYNQLQSQQELSGQQVISLLMGWEDHYTSHKFENLYWNDIWRVSASEENEVDDIDHEDDYKSNDEEDDNNSDEESSDDETFSYDKDETFTLEAETKSDIGENKITTHNQRMDYIYRPVEFEHLSIYEFVAQLKIKK
eukprot:Lithocolla_globosa_v1_NODE_391_length_4199_cov_7.277027.p1 type:complete len:544 gc:universal NODE_391_length_4199_cov_7.277027:1691-60(-)